MNANARKFEDLPAVRSHVPLIIGVTGASGSGKTYSALRLGTGIQSVRGGEIFGIDTEADRMLHYADYFKFRHLHFEPPYSPLDYLGAIEHCVKRGAKIIIVDSMSHEHDGDGGVLEMIDEFLERKCGEDWDKRKQFNFVAQIEPKKQRKKLNRRIVGLGQIVFILCYRAEVKIKPKKGAEPEDLGWQPITTSKLPYDMTVRFLLTPSCGGVPSLLPANPAEKMLVKNPRQFEGWFEPGKPLSEEMGRKLAEWAQGGSGSDEFQALQAEYERCSDASMLADLEKKRDVIWKKASPHKLRLKQAADDARARVEAAKAAKSTGAVDDAMWIKKLKACESLEQLATEWNAATEAFGGMVPMDVGDAYEDSRERLTEAAARASE